MNCLKQCCRVFIAPLTVIYKDNRDSVDKDINWNSLNHVWAINSFFCVRVVPWAFQMFHFPSILWAQMWYKRVCMEKFTKTARPHLLVKCYTYICSLGCKWRQVEPNHSKQETKMKNRRQAQVTAFHIQGRGHQVLEEEVGVVECCWLEQWMQIHEKSESATI